MTFDEAVKATESGMIYQESKPYHHRGVKTTFSYSERKQYADWMPVEFKEKKRIPYTDIPEEVQHIINNSFHTSSIDANVRPLIWGYELVRRLIEEGYVLPKTEEMR